MFRQAQQHNRYADLKGGSRSNPFLYTILVVNGFNILRYCQKTLNLLSTENGKIRHNRY